MEEIYIFINISFISAAMCMWLDYLKHTYYKDVRYDFISLFHSIITGIPSYIVYITNPNIIVYLSETPSEMISYHYKIIPCITLGYGIYDIYDAIRTKQMDYFIHGSIIILGYGTMLYYNGLHLALIGCINECSTIFLNIAKTTYTKLLFFVVFTYIRFYLFPIIMYNYTYTNPHNIVHYYITLTCFISLNILNCVWYKKMITIMLNYKKNKT